MGRGPRLAETRSRNPQALDGVLGHGFFGPPPAKAVLADEAERAIAGARDFQDVLDLLRSWHHERLFQIGVAILRQTLVGDQAGAALSDLAEAAIGTLVPRIEEIFAARHGSVAGSGFCVIAMGRRRKS